MAIKCPKCHYDNPDDTFYCGKCATGLKLSEAVSFSRTETLKTSQKEPLRGKTIARKYKIIEKLGEGGMGVVFKAKDAKLDRLVALKFLPPDMTKDKEAKKRFIQEAQAAAALDHPNICTVHEVNEVEGQAFIAMAYIAGQSLKERIAAGPLEIGAALDIAIQVAEGLKEAHGKGIIHRDIKPGNIMLTEKGQAKIMDFGLVKLEWKPDFTKTSTIMGTVAYMSPEQARGEAVDQRTDIWSFGVMLYEMLAGTRAFGNKSDQALLYAILNESPEPLSRVRPDIPRPIEQIIAKALEKDRSRRYQTLAEMLKELKASRTSEVSPPKPEKSIVVLPFDNISPDPEQDYFCDGMTEEIISDLSKVHSLRVISRTSSMMFKGTKKDVATIVREVNVRYVLEGSVRKAGNNLRITAQLIDAVNDTHLWAEKYAGTLDDIFDIQEKVSCAIVDALKLKLTPEEKQNIAERPLDNVQAYEFYIRARQAVWKGGEDALGQAIRYIQNGLDIIGDSALLYAGLGYIYYQIVNFGFKQAEQDFYLQKSEECAKKALELDPESPQGHALLGMIHQAFHGNQKESIRCFKQALAADPNNHEALLWLGVGYGCMVGKTQEAILLFERLIQIDPFDAQNYLCLGFTYIYDGQFDIGLTYMRKGFQMDPVAPYIQILFACALAYNKCSKEAVELINRAAKIAPKLGLTQFGLFLKYALQGQKKRALQLLTPEFKKMAQRDPQWSQLLAGFCSLLGEKEEALDWLENAVNRGFTIYPFLNEYDPFLENIRGEVRFKKLMGRVKKEWEEFKA